MAFIYEMEVDPEAANVAQSIALRQVGFNKSVLEIGCAAGHVTRAMAGQGCRVVGVEIDPQAAEVARQWAADVVVGDADGTEAWEALSVQPVAPFDVALFGDVLEHLRDPLAALRNAARLVAPTGTFVLSMPNVAHGDVRLALLAGSFRYREFGLLDRTHLRFFTKESMRELCHQAGLVIVETERVVMPLFHTELDLVRDDFDRTIVDRILEDPEAETYQFVFRAVHDNGDQAVRALAERVAELSDRAHHEEVRAALLRAEMRDHADAVAAAAARAVEIERYEAAHRELAATIAGLRAELSAAHQELEAVYATKAMRLLRPLRRAYGRVSPAGRGSRHPRT